MVQMLEPNCSGCDSCGGRVLGPVAELLTHSRGERVPCKHTDGSYRRSPEVFMHTLLISALYSLIQTAAEPLSPLLNRIFIMFLNLCQFQCG